jgi:hypothetical protein
MEIPEVIQAYETKYAIMVNAKETAQKEGDVARVLYYETELVKTDTEINQLRAIVGQRPREIEGPNIESLAKKVAELLQPPPVLANPVPDELKAAIRQAAKLFDTIVDGDGMTFFGKGLTDDKQAEVQQVQDALKKWVDQ